LRLSYSDQFTYEFHLKSVQEMLRVAAEVRIFPLLTLALKRSPYIDQLTRDLESDGFYADVCPVDYELQRGENQMIQTKRRSSAWGSA